MADLFIDWDVLSRTKGRLRDIEDLLNQPCRELAALPLDAVGQEDLRGKMRDFGDEWSYGIGKIGEFSGGAVDALDKIRQGFDDLETDLTNALKGE